MDKKSQSLFTALLTVGMFVPIFVFASHPSNWSCSQCPDADGDGYRAWCADPLASSNISYGCSDFPPPDCSDTDAWSHRFGSKDIASVKVEYDPAYTAKILTDSKFTPKPPFNASVIDATLRVTITFKTKKCGMTITPDTLPMDFYLTTKNNSGEEIPVRLAPAAGLKKIDTGTNTLTYQATLKADANTSFSYWNGTGAEEFIKSVAEKRPVQLKLIGPNVGISADTPKYSDPLPMTNCAQVYGGGTRRVVYMRTDDVGIGLNNFMALSSQAIYTGFNAIEPFKSYRSNFSHYVDLKSHILSTSELVTVSNGRVTVDGGSLVRTSSSCGRFSTLYFLFDDSNRGPFNAKFYNRVVYMDTDFLDEESEAIEVGSIVVHEAAHAMAGLLDEYNRSGKISKNLEDYLLKMANSGRNCSTKPSIHYSYFSKSYGRLDIQPCVLDALYRPSENSMMMGAYRGNEDRFNVISCGYLLKAIKKGGSAKSYFPECSSMPGIVPVGQ